MKFQTSMYMKNTLKMMMFALLAFFMIACGEKKVTEADLKKSETALFNEDGSVNEKVAPQMHKKILEFVKQNPDDPNAPLWLFKAMEISYIQKDSDQCIAIGNQLIDNYHDYEKTPMAMFILGSFIYEDQLKDLDKAREMYERILNDYPDSELIPTVEMSIKYLGMSPEQILVDIQMSQMEEGEEEY